MDKLIEAVKKFAYQEVERTGMPIKMHVDLSCEVGKNLAEKLGANVVIVEIGTLLMDCMIGQALQEGRLKDHVQMSLDKTNELLSNFEIDEVTKENIRQCVVQHHGATTFHSIESEICCNADCYRFASIKGFNIANRFLRDMPYQDLIVLLENKLIEKEKALTLSECKVELLGQIELLHSYICELKK